MIALFKNFENLAVHNITNLLPSWTKNGKLVHDFHKSTIFFLPSLRIAAPLKNLLTSDFHLQYIAISLNNTLFFRISSYCIKLSIKNFAPLMVFFLIVVLCDAKSFRKRCIMLIVMDQFQNQLYFGFSTLARSITDKLD